MIPAAVIRLRTVSRLYGAGTPHEVRALDGVDLDLDAGSLTVLHGPSGSGKTTLLGLVGALDRPTGGRILMGDLDLSGLPDSRLAALRRRVFGFLFQSFNLIPRLPVWANVSYPLVPTGMPRADRRGRAESLLSRLGLVEAADRLPEDLSGGEQQRVALARALVNDPAVLLLDEPTSAVDAATAERLLDLARELASAGTTVVAASHDARLLEMAHTTVELARGRVVGITRRARIAPA
jgi:putative ABC transport system ATP-binding protein